MLNSRQQALFGHRYCLAAKFTGGTFHLAIVLNTRHTVYTRRPSCFYQVSLYKQVGDSPLHRRHFSFRVRGALTRNSFTDFWSLATYSAGIARPYFQGRFNFPSRPVDSYVYIISIFVTDFWIGGLEVIDYIMTQQHRSVTWLSI